MNELKTLKDFEISCADEDYNWQTKEVPKKYAEINKESLRQEAIKWIKELKTGKNIPDELGIGSGSPETMIDWIKCFFNITDEDLK